VWGRRGDACGLFVCPQVTFLNWNYNPSSRSAATSLYPVYGGFLYMKDSYAFATASVTMRIESSWGTLVSFSVQSSMTLGLSLNPYVQYTGEYSNTWDFNIYPRDNSFIPYTTFGYVSVPIVAILVAVLAVIDAGR
jgi:hypothetical protein